VYPKASTAHGKLRAWARTDRDGNYRFDTIRPGAYPAGTIPQHVHLHIIEPGRATYFIEDVTFDDDPLLTAKRRREMRSGRGGPGETHPTKDADGRWRVRRDIILGEKIPGYDRLPSTQSTSRVSAG
jgi:protocatechuate 3,4-dioxygenase beta subunit